METITSTLKDAIKSQGRQTSAYVEFLINVEDFDAGDAVSVLVGSESEYSDIATLPSGVRFREKTAHFQQDCFVLDNDRYFPDDDNIVGFWSSEIPALLPSVDIKLTFNVPITNPYLTVYWGEDEYPTIWTTQSDYLPPVPGGSIWGDPTQTTFPTYADATNPVSEIIISIKEWVNDTQVKILGFDLGTGRLYKDDMIVDMKIREQIDHLSVTIPSNDVSVTIDNSTREFDLLAPSGLYQELTINAPINVWLGHKSTVGIEYIEMGKFFLNEFEQDAGKMTFRGQDIIGTLDNKLYYGWQGDYDVEPTAKDFIDGFMSIIGIEDYIVDSDLDVYDGANTSFGWTDTKPLTVREMLSKICIRYGCNVWVDRQGFIRFDYFNDKDTFFFDAKTPTGNVVDLDSCEERNPKILEVERMKFINWYAERKFITAGTQTIVPVREYTVTDGSDIILNMDMYVSSTLTVTNKTTTGTADVLLASGDGHCITVKTMGTGTVTFGLTDYIFVNDTYNDREVTDTDMISLYNDTYGEDISHIAVNNGSGIDVFLGNIYDSDVGIAPLGFYPDPILWFFERNKKFEYRANWIGDISNNIGDIVQVENEFNAIKYMMIIEQEFTYSGALRGYIKGVGN